MNMLKSFSEPQRTKSWSPGVCLLLVGALKNVAQLHLVISCRRLIIGACFIDYRNTLLGAMLLTYILSSLTINLLKGACIFRCRLLLSGRQFPNLGYMAKGKDPAFMQIEICLTPTSPGICCCLLCIQVLHNRLTASSLSLPWGWTLATLPKLLETSMSKGRILTSWHLSHTSILGSKNCRPLPRWPAPCHACCERWSWAPGNYQLRF